MKSLLLKELIQQWCIDQGRYGLTIPFLIGAEKEFGDKKEYDFDILFEDLLNAKTNYLITYCGDLKEYIIGLPKSESTPLNMLKHFGSIYIGVDKFEKYESLEELKNYLKYQYSKFISLKLFSKNMDSEDWEYFDQQDIAEIKKAKDSANLLMIQCSK